MSRRKCDTFWSSVAQRYLEAAEAVDEQDNQVSLVIAPDAGHFEMVDPATSTWPLLRDAALSLLEPSP